MQRVNLFPNPRMTSTGTQPRSIDATVVMNGDGSFTIKNSGTRIGGYATFILDLQPGAKLHAHSVSTFTADATNMRGARMGVRAYSAGSLITQTYLNGVKGYNENDLDFTVPSDGKVTIEFRGDKLVDNVRVSHVIIEDATTWAQAEAQAVGGGLATRSGSQEPQGPSSIMGGR